MLGARVSPWELLRKAALEGATDGPLANGEGTAGDSNRADDSDVRSLNKAMANRAIIFSLEAGGNGKGSQLQHRKSFKPIKRKSTAPATGLSASSATSPPVGSPLGQRRSSGTGRKMSMQAGVSLARRASQSVRSSGTGGPRCAASGRASTTFIEELQEEDEGEAEEELVFSLLDTDGDGRITQHDLTCAAAATRAFARMEPPRPRTATHRHRSVCVSPPPPPPPHPSPSLSLHIRPQRSPNLLFPSLPRHTTRRPRMCTCAPTACVRAGGYACSSASKPPRRSWST